MEKVIYVGTDCDDTKFDAIKGIFVDKYTMKNVSMISVTQTRIKTPVSHQDLLCGGQERLDNLITSLQENPCIDFFCTIQRGFFFDGIVFHLTAIVLIKSSDGKLAKDFTASVQIDRSVSDAKIRDKNQRMSTLFCEKFPDWREKTSIYTLLTKESEREWLQTPLRHCIKNIFA